MTTPAMLVPGERVSTSTAIATTVPPSKTIQHSNSKRPTVIVYPTVSPESVIIPIVSSILGFPLLALLVICCLRRRAKLARERARRRNCGMTNAGLSLVRLGAARTTRTPSILRTSRDRPSLDLATVLEERPEPEITQIEIVTPDRDDRLQIGRLLSQPARFFLEGSR